MNISAYKLRHPVRNQVEMQMLSLDEIIPKDHVVRDVWEFALELDITPFLRSIKTYTGEEGRSAASPRVLIAIWLFACVDGVVSSRKIEELCKCHDAYRWLLGGVSLNRNMLCNIRNHSLSDFEHLLSNSLAIMIKAGVVCEEDLAQDGSKVRASAGRSSFRKESTLIELERSALEYLEELKEEYKKDPDCYDRRKKAKEIQQVQKRKVALAEAKKEIVKCRKKRSENAKRNRQTLSKEDLEKCKGSTTDPEARIMRMADGGFRPAYNVQFATGVDSRVIYGLRVTNDGNDYGQALPLMIATFKKFCAFGFAPFKHWIADSGYSSKEDVEDAKKVFPDCKYCVPGKTDTAHVAKKGDSEAVLNWREYLGTDGMKEAYKLRCSTSEFSNAQFKNRGLSSFLVRGIEKVTQMTYLGVISHNMQRFWDLRKKRSCQ